MKFKIVLLFVFLSVAGIEGFAESQDTSVTRIFILIYNQKFEEANTALSTQKQEMDGFYFQILKLDLYWWKYSMSGLKKDAENLKQVLEKEDLEDLDTTNQKIIHLIKTSYSFRYEIKRYNFIGAFFLRSDITNQIEKIKKENIPVKGERLVLFDLYLALLEYSNNSINPFFSKSKSEACKLALSKIQKYTRNNDIIVHTLAHYFLGRIYMKVEREPEKAKVQFKILSEEYPQNPYFADLAANL